MSRKASSNSAHGFGDIIGVALLAVALLLLVAQWSFDHDDISFLTTRLNKPTHNWIGPLGAYLAWASFIPFGLVGYLLPPLFAAFGLAYLLNFPSHLRERLRWSLVWSATLLLSLTGLLYIMDSAGWLGKVRESIGSLSAGGWLGF
jgi:S-DNA-T family DNA segregation ATPase FtsK/SpoIIIE